MDQDTRNKLQRATQQVRRILEEEFAEQLEGRFDVLSDGTIAEQPGAHLDATQRLKRQKLVQAISHIESGGKSTKDAIEEYLRQAAFTILNRFVALRMLEARDLLQECVSKGDESSGFKEFCGLAPGLSALPDGGYRLYLECLCDELTVEIKVLFDRRDPTTLLWPRRSALTAMLDVLAQPELASVWAEDETIGWVYQYFNGDEERTKMRAESQAPRNSRELAVRNQFFTPRYVVQFLTDNTLGRTWYEMMQGDTQLAHLDYLVRRPNEVFLAEGESAPESDTDESELSQEELLQQTVHVPFRAKKDPRELRILDPACGSGHFLLYTFDLLITIYEEAWADTEAAAFTETGTQLRTDYESLEDLRQAMPELILRHNLHGVDIDPRAAQIAALALWMRAQRAYNQFEVDRAQRPPITKTNIVVAEPMPGDAELVDEFAASLKPAVLGDLFKKMVEEMKLAGELGSLLKIEESIAKAVKEARIEYVDFLKQRQNYLPGMNPPSEQKSLDLSEITDDSFYDSADEKIIAALGSFAESAAGAGGVRRQLFAGDAAQGVAFIELMRKRFDAVLMNPPFGAATTKSKTPIIKAYSWSKSDLYAAFVARGAELLQARGRCGALTSRTAFSLESLATWRKNLLFGLCKISCAADLGYGVLDSAMVEAASYVLGMNEAGPRAAVFSTLNAIEKRPRLEENIRKLAAGHYRDGIHVVDPNAFAQLPSQPFCYQISESLLNTLFAHPPSKEHGFVVRKGMETSDDFRFLRTSWEVPSTKEHSAEEWIPYAKGGGYSPFHSNTQLQIDWSQSGKQVKAFALSKSAHWSRTIRSPDYYFRRGLTYSERTTSNLSLRQLSEGSIFSAKGPGIFHENIGDLMFLLGMSYSRTYRLMIELLIGGGDSSVSGSAARDYRPGLLADIPIPKVSPALIQRVAGLAQRCVDLTREVLITDFQLVGLEALRGLCRQDESWSELRTRVHESQTQAAVEITRINHEIDELSINAYGITRAHLREIETIVGSDVWSLGSESTSDAEEEMERASDVSEKELLDFVKNKRGAHRQTLKMSYVSTRRLELLSHLTAMRPDLVATSQHFCPSVAENQTLALAVIHDALERAFNFIDPINPVSTRPLETMDSHIMVADQGHPNDIFKGLFESRIEVGGHFSASICREAASELNVSGPAQDIRTYCNRYLFGDHLRTYSKSRRKAPIYWQLATPSASYSVWCYYHRLTRDTFFRVANDYVTPKVDHEERKLNTLRQEAGPDPSSKQRKDIDAQETFVAELRAFLTEVKRIAPLWNPNLNDGVIINFAPLWRLVPQHKAWQKECKKVWDKLVKGDYDWAHLAMHLWPERVVPKCQDDRSLAIAHGLEDDFWYEDDNEKWQKREPPEDGWEPVLKKLIDERTSPEVKAALESLLEAPVPSGRARSRRSR